MEKSRCRRHRDCSAPQGAKLAQRLSGEIAQHFGAEIVLRLGAFGAKIAQRLGVLGAATAKRLGTVDGESNCVS